MEILEHDAQAAPKVWYLLAFEVCQVEIPDTRFSAQGRILSDEGADDGGFSAADLAGQIHEFAGKDGQVEMVDHHDFTVGNVGGAELDDRRDIRAHRNDFDVQK